MKGSKTRRNIFNQGQIFVGKMISVDEAVIARLKVASENFEILVDPKKALRVKRGEDVPLEELVAAQSVFTDAHKGEQASEKNINRIFGTNDFKELAYKIIKKGEVQITTEQRREMAKEKRRKVASIIARRSINPQLNTPHTAKRISNAMDEAGVNVDPFSKAEEQVPDILKSLKPLIPIKIESLKIAVKIPPEYTAKSYGELRGHLKKEEWQPDGSWVGVMVIPAGVQEDFYNKINSLTKGEAKIKILEKLEE